VLQDVKYGMRMLAKNPGFTAVAVLIGSTIGSGIFRTPALIATRVPAPVPMLGVWVLG
jgi:APA family basic amino acid/polyamine antiporter